MLGNIIGGFIVILVGTALLPTVAQQVGTAQADGNVTGASDTLVGLTTLFFSLAIATSAIGKRNAHRKSNFSMHNPESRLKSRWLNLDKTEASIQKPLFVFENARETDKGLHINGGIYSPTSCYI